jgi:hypothetical protein
MRQNITFEFPSLIDLLAFRNEIRTSSFEMNPKKKYFTCECTEDQVNLAIQKFGAFVISETSKMLTYL